VDLTNQTNASLIFSNAAANTVGYYSCDVTDQTGSTVTSSNAALNISGIEFSLWQGLVAYYPLHGNAKDYSVLSNDGVTYGVTQTNGKSGYYGTAYNFNGSSYIEAADVIPEYSSNSTITCWVKTANGGGAVSKPRAYGDTVGFGVGISSSSFGVDTWKTGYGWLNTDPYWGALHGGVIANGGVSTTNSIADNLWHQLVAVVDGTNMYFYCNGVFIAGYTYVSDLIRSDKPLQIGRNGSGGYQGGSGWFTGSISDVRIYNRALSSNEVSALFQAEAPVPTNNQTITFLTIPAKAYGTAPFSLTATSSAGTYYPITYTSSDSTVATVFSNKVTITGVGSCLITASQPGDFIYKAATNVSRMLTVTQGNQSIDFLAPASRSYSTNTFSLPSNSSAGLPISYDSSSAAVATISGNVVTITGVGSTTITATQAGNKNYKAAPAVVRTLTVTKAAQKISFADLPARTYGDGAFSLSATASSGLPVTYVSANTNVATISGATVTIRGAGTASITASQAGNANYSAAPAVAKTLTVAKAAQTMTFYPTTPVTFIKNATFPLTASCTSGGAITFGGGNTNVLTISGKTATMKAKGTVNVTATAAATTNYNAASATNSITLQ
jgi:hypothetical protein